MDRASRLTKSMLWWAVSIALAFAAGVAFCRVYYFDLDRDSQNLLRARLALVRPDQMPYARLFAPPAVPLTANELRGRLPAWLGMDQIPPFAVETVEREAIGSWEGVACKGTRYRLGTSFGVRWLVRLEPEAAANRKWVLLVRHGHEGPAAFAAQFGDLLQRLSSTGCVIYLPLDEVPERVDEYFAVHVLDLLDRSLMGARVAELRGMLDRIQGENPGARVIVIGHSMGSMVGYYGACLDDRVAALATDYCTDVNHELGDLRHCESVRGLYQLLVPESAETARTKCRLRPDVPRTAITFHQPYGYPDRDALVAWVRSVIGRPD